MALGVFHNNNTTFFKNCHCRGYNIGIRLIDEFLAKSKTTKCVDFRDTADKVARGECVSACSALCLFHINGFAPAGGLQDVSECKVQPFPTGMQTTLLVMW